MADDPTLDEMLRLAAEDERRKKEDLERYKKLGELYRTKSRLEMEVLEIEAKRVEALRASARAARSGLDAVQQMGRTFTEIVGIGRALATGSPLAALSGAGGLLSGIGAREVARRQEEARAGPQGAAAAAARQSGGLSMLAMGAGPAGAAVTAITALGEAAQAAASSVLGLAKSASPGFAAAWSEAVQYFMAAIGQHFVPALVQLGATIV